MVDLHALTIAHDPARVRGLTREMATLLLAAGLDPRLRLLFQQSRVPAHAELAYLLECTAYDGELRRMIQFKEKAREQASVRVPLPTYPVLMAADVLLYDTDAAPVGDDQRQHMELTRDAAIRFNRLYGDTFVVPKAAHPPVAGRVMNLQNPDRKRAKSDASDAGVIYLLDEPEVVRRKIMRGVTDSGSEVAYDPGRRPGVSNLLEILVGCTGEDTAVVADRYASYGSLKKDVAEALVAELEPLRKRYAELAADPGDVDQVLAEGAARASDLAAPGWHRPSARSDSSRRDRPIYRRPRLLIERIDHPDISAGHIGDIAGHQDQVTRLCRRRHQPINDWYGGGSAHLSPNLGNVARHRDDPVSEVSSQFTEPCVEHCRLIRVPASEPLDTFPYLTHHEDTQIELCCPNCREPLTGSGMASLALSDLRYDVRVQEVAQLKSTSRPRSSERSIPSRSRSGAAARNSLKSRGPLDNRSNSSAATTTTTSFPLRVIVCGPSRRERSTSSLSFCFASCSCHATAPSNCLDRLDCSGVPR